MTINTNFVCDNFPLEIDIRNNINGDFSKVENISNIEPGAFISIFWNDKKLMLPYSPRAGFLSFSDKKWDFRYNLDKTTLNEERPVLYELLSNGQFIEHKCYIAH